MAFENMYILRLLKIYSSSPEVVQELHLPKKLHSLPYELRLLHWEKYPLQSLPQEFDPSHLVELNMPYKQLQNLWRGTKKLVEVDELSEACSLEKIDLQGCSSLESIPHTDQLRNLQLMNLSGCTRIKHAEIKKKIKALDLEGGLRETESESMAFSTLAVKLEPGDNTETY